MYDDMMDYDVDDMVSWSYRRLVVDDSQDAMAETDPSGDEDDEDEDMDEGDWVSDLLKVCFDVAC